MCIFELSLCLWFVEFLDYNILWIVYVKENNVVFVIVINNLRFLVNSVFFIVICVGFIYCWRKFN